MEGGKGKIPTWLMSMINAEFNTTQKQKEEEKGYFCVECGGESLTRKQKEKLHNGHKVVQAYNTSRTYGYKQKDVLRLGSRVLDVSKIRPFSINNGHVYFPKSRSSNGVHMKNIGRNGCCRNCGYVTDNMHWYCSIMCKVVMEPGVMDSVDIGEDLESKKTMMGFPSLVAAAAEVNQSIKDVNHVDNDNDNHNGLVNFRKRSRKSIPYRAPLF